MSLKSQIYVSSAVTPLDDQALMALLAQARRNNAAHGVTGMLLYDSGNFMQALEGPADAVDATFARIRRDSRHKSIIAMHAEYLMERAFADWTMGFANAARLRAKGAAGVSDFLALPSADWGRSGSTAKMLLASFRDQLRGG